MMNQCEIVQDLLPLYADGACSTSSEEMIQEHLKNCPECKQLYEKLCADAGEEKLKEEMAGVVAKHKKQVKKKRVITITTSVAATATVAILAICLLIWRICPNPFSSIIPISQSDVIDFSANAIVQYFEEGQPLSDSYRIHSPGAAGNEVGQILEILGTSSYQQDLRNLLPWGVNYVESGENYDGRSVMLLFSTGNQKDAWIQISINSDIMIVSTGEYNGMRIYHPTNQKSFDNLMAYFEEYGEKQ